MKKRKTFPKKQESTVKRRQVGKRTSQREVIEETIHFPASVRPMDIFKPLSPEESIANFEKKYLAPIEKWADAVIKAEGRPADPGEERISRRWYASEMLREIRFLREAIKKINCGSVANSAFRLGKLEQEQYDLEYLDEESKKGPRGRKWDPIVMWFVRARYRKNPDVRGKDLLEELSKYDAFNSLRIGNVKLFMEEGLIKIYEHEEERRINKNAIYRYLERIKEKPPAR